MHDTFSTKYLKMEPHRTSLFASYYTVSNRIYIKVADAFKVFMGIVFDEDLSQCNYVAVPASYNLPKLFCAYL